MGDVKKGTSAYLRANNIQIIGNKDRYKHPTGSCEGGIEAVEVFPLPLWAIMFDDVFCAEVIGSMSSSNQPRDENSY